MRDEHWRTLSEIAQVLGYPEASISAQLRHLRKPDFGSYLVDKRRRPNSPGYWEYRVRVVHVGQLEMFGSLQKHNPMRGH